MTKEEKEIRDFCAHHADWWPSTSQVREIIALAQQPRPWVGLTDEEIIEMMGYDKQYGYIPQYARNFVEAITAKLKERNHD